MFRWPVCIVAIAITLAAASNARAEEYVIICSGQSNMFGVAASEKMPDDLRPVPANVIYYRQFNPAKITAEKSFDGDKRYGPVPRFAHALAEARPKDRFIILHDSVGGSSLSQWLPEYQPKDPRGKDGYLYKAMQPRLSAIHKAHPKAKPLAFLWLQGEADKGPAAPVYGENLAKLIANIRRDTGTKELLAVIAEPGLADQGVYDGIHAFVKSDKRAAVVETKALGKGQLHFNDKGYDEIGKMFAATLVGLMPAK